MLSKSFACTALEAQVMLQLALADLLTACLLAVGFQVSSIVCNTIWPTWHSTAMLTVATMQVMVTAAAMKVLLMLAVKSGQPSPVELVMLVSHQ